MSDVAVVGYPNPEMEEVIDETKANLNEWFVTPKQLMWYEYDFGDSWMHEIKLMKTLPSVTAQSLPTVLDGARHCPPEDCGSIPGYERLLEILRDPNHHEHQEMLEWMDIKNANEFNPEEFDRTKVRFRNPRKVLREYEERM